MGEVIDQPAIFYGHITHYGTCHSLGLLMYRLTLAVGDDNFEKLV
jgi:hypothetical protein